MKLTGKEILKRMKKGDIVIDPFNEDHLNPNSVDLTLGPKLLVYQREPGVRVPDRGSYSTNMDASRRAYVRRKKEGPIAACTPIELAQWSDVLDMAEDNPTYPLEIPDKGLVLVPGRLYLAATAEYTETHNLVPCIEGRSSIGRLGINIHSTAGFGDVGFCGTWTLEISVIEPIRIYAGVRFCQIHYDEVTGDITPYDSKKYQGQREPRPSGIWKELTEKKPKD